MVLGSSDTYRSPKRFGYVGTVNEFERHGGDGMGGGRGSGGEGMGGGRGSGSRIPVPVRVLEDLEVTGCKTLERSGEVEEASVLGSAGREEARGREGDGVPGREGVREGVTVREGLGPRFGAMVTRGAVWAKPGPEGSEEYSPGYLGVKFDGKRCSSEEREVQWLADRSPEIVIHLQQLP